jgi:acetyltransferase-like isoleucine patch superfamily enzyme
MQAAALRSSEMWLTNLARRGLRRLTMELAVRVLEVQGAAAERTLPKFANQPKHLKIELPRRIINPDRIFFGDHVWLGPDCFIVAVKEYPSPSLRHPGRRHELQKFSPEIHIGDRVTSSGHLVIGAARQVKIGADVMFASNVTILDNLHGFGNAREPYKYQPLQRIAPVEVGRGCWIGQNVVILPSVTIGEMSIVGANSVVTHSIPERSIAVGAPARVIKQWNEKTGQWQAYDGPRASLAQHG